MHVKSEINLTNYAKQKEKPGKTGLDGRIKIAGSRSSGTELKRRGILEEEQNTLQAANW